VAELVDLRDRLSRGRRPPRDRAAPRHVRKVPTITVLTITVLTITGLGDTVILADTVDDATHLITNTRSASRHFVWRP
jgi:hypothetical protein